MHAVIVTQVSKSLHHVLLPVRQTVKVKVVLRVWNRGIHTHSHVIAPPACRVVERQHRGANFIIVIPIGDCAASRKRIGSDIIAVEEDAGVLLLPLVGQAISVGIDRARVESAAGVAAGVRRTRVTIFIVII